MLAGAFLFRVTAGNICRVFEPNRQSGKRIAIGESVHTILNHIEKAINNLQHADQPITKT